MSILDIFVYYTRGTSFLEITGGLLIEVLQVNLLLILFLLHRRCRSRFTHFISSFFIGVLGFGWECIYIIGDCLNLWLSRFPELLAFLLANGGLIAVSMVSLLLRGGKSSSGTQSERENLKCTP